MTWLRRHWRRVVITALVVVAAPATAVVIGHGGGTGKRPAPTLPTQVLQGPRVTLATLRGHATAVVFWASWCGPCKAEAPAIERFVRSAAGRGRLISINTDDGTTTARRFIARYGWTFPVLSDPHGKAADQFRLLGLPTTIVLNGRGQIVQALIGPQTAHSLRAAISTA